jgi:hypothetical protein
MLCPGLEETFENLILDQLDVSQYGPSLLDPDFEVWDDMQVVDARCVAAPIVLCRAELFVPCGGPACSWIMCSTEPCMRGYIVLEGMFHQPCTMPCCKSCKSGNVQAVRLAIMRGEIRLLHSINTLPQHVSPSLHRLGRVKVPWLQAALAGAGAAR